MMMNLITNYDNNDESSGSIIASKKPTNNRKQVTKKKKTQQTKRAQKKQKKNKRLSPRIPQRGRSLVPHLLLKRNFFYFLRLNMAQTRKRTSGTIYLSIMMSLSRNPTVSMMTTSITFRIILQEKHSRLFKRFVVSLQGALLFWEKSRMIKSWIITIQECVESTWISHIPSKWMFHVTS